MNPSDFKKLDVLRKDYACVAGEPFQTFFCPVLFRDEAVELCRAHLVNQSFVGASRRWRVQRKDVDGFFGAFFESDFVKSQQRRAPDEEPFAIFADKDRSRQLEPKVYLDDKRIEHYVAGDVPPHHSRFAVEFDGRTVSLGLKLHPDETLAAAEQNWEVRIEKDLRLATCVSLLKAGHLALFEMLGYRYALSAGGHFMGFDILGKFFLKSRTRDRAEIIENAVTHFEECAHMVRSIESGAEELEGTAQDGLLYMCTRGTELRWAFLILVRTGPTAHAVLVPMFEDPIAIDVFLKFLRNRDEQLEAALAKFDGKQWLLSKDLKRFHWPKSATLL
jgi:hypothetical protein